jgi:hypothetical protein
MGRRAIAGAAADAWPPPVSSIYRTRRGGRYFGADAGAWVEAASVASLVDLAAGQHGLPL